MSQSHDQNWINRVVETFLRGNLSVLLILISLIAGAVALMVTPREEEPQIVVPLADVIVQMPGASAAEIEQQLSSRLERLLYQIDGVEYVYSMSRPGTAIVTVRFYVGEDREDSLIKLYNKISMSQDVIPPGVTGWVVKPIEIDDVPIVYVTLWSRSYDDHVLRRVAEQVEVGLQAVPNTARTEIVGGRRRQIQVEIDTDSLAARQLTPLDVVQVLRGANVNVPAGSFTRDNRESLLESGPYIASAAELETLVIGVFAGSPVYLRDVATVRDAPEETAVYTRIGFGPGAHHDAHGEASADGGEYPAVTVAIAKRRGSNAVWVARDIEHKLEELRRQILPTGVEATITRNYGETANHKVNELVQHLSLAIIIVVGLIGFALGWREALIVVTAVPITFALTLLVNYLVGYSINRVTLFALILSLGLVVDDPIVDVENVFRHFRLRKESPLKAVLTAVNEVRPPIIVATMVVIFSFLPMFFITGMMGPYMRPMALNVPVAMLMSMVVAFTITPWLSYHVLKGEYGKDKHALVVERTLTYRVYQAIVTPFLAHRWAAWLLIATMVVLFALSALLPAVGLVPLKMLPFDNKNEFQIVVDMPEGTTVEATDAAVRAIAGHLRTAPEVTNFLTFAGTASPIDFNGMVRHYYLRRGPNVGEIRANLLAKHARQQQSHEILLRLRNGLTEIAQRHGAVIQLVEVPPGPPVFATLVAEIYGQPHHDYAALAAAAEHVKGLMETEDRVVDIDTSVEADQTKYVFVVDREKASLHGVSAEVIGATVRLAQQGLSPGQDVPMTVASGSGMLHSARDLNPVPIVLRVPQAERSSLADMERLTVKTASGEMIRLAELGHFEETIAEKMIYHKNLRRVAYVFGDVAGRAPPEAVLGLQSKLKKNPLPAGIDVVWNGEGEWKITLDVFRDLGLAFGAAMVAIYILLVAQMGSFIVPVVVMLAIPLTVLGVMPGFWLLNAIRAEHVGGFLDPVYFTATGMIGMIALAGIVTRDSIILVDFIHLSLARGRTLFDAIMESRVVRLRPILLTASAAMLGAVPIIIDPIFSGLAWSLIFGLFASTLFTLFVIPVVYWLLYANKPGHGLPMSTMEQEEA